MKSPVVLLALLSLAVLPHSGCKQDPSPPVDASRDLSSGDGPTGSKDVSPADGPAGDASGHLDGWPASGYVFRPYKLAGCGGKGPGTEDCHARLFIDAKLCSPAKPCDRMVVYWSGGEQGCAKGLYDVWTKAYATEGFVAACAQPFTTADEAGLYPYYEEFDRMHLLIQHLRQQPEVKAAWTGARLLISGVSHGGTAPLAVIAARAALRTYPATWTGSTDTAIVLYDGISNTATLEEWTQGKSSCGSYHARWVERYGDGKPLVHSCLNKKCYCSNPPHKTDWEKDTLVIGASYPKSPYTCQDFTPKSGKVLYRFVSCGGQGKDPCNALGDMIPDDQQQLAFQALKSCAQVEASYEAYLPCGHSVCGSKKCGLDDSLAWLKTRGW